MKDSQLYTIVLFIILTVMSAGQERSSVLFTENNILKFADYLYAEEDYLRAIIEYRRYLNHSNNDSILLRIAEGFQKMQRYEESKSEYKKLFNTSLHSDAVTGYAFNEFLLGNFFALREINESKNDQIIRLKYLSQLYPSEPLPDKNLLSDLFSVDASRHLLMIYERKANPPYKSELKASLLSVLLPGAGKIYTGNYGDGITAFIVTSLIGYIAYDNFKAGHDTRAWIFTGIGTLFYAGNIYGSAAAAKIHNAAIQLNYKHDLDLFLKNNNYFLSDD